VWFEQFTDVNLAITRDKQLKTWERFLKNNLIEKLNPEWNDLTTNWLLKGNM